MIKLAAAIFIGIMFLGCSDESVSDHAFLTRSVTVNGNNYGYRVYIPQNREPKSEIPVMLYLHGTGGRGDDNESQLRGLSEIVDQGQFSFIVVVPQCREGKFWAGEMNEQALAALDAAVAEFGGDTSRLYLAGFSMGANGTWQNGLVRSEKFAALVPIAGDVAPTSKLSDDVLATLPPRLREAAVSDNPYKVFADGIGSTPVWIFHGSNDEAVPVSESRKIDEAFKIAGNLNVNYTEYEGAGHLIVGRALSEPRLFEWLANQRLSDKK